MNKSKWLVIRWLWFCVSRLGGRFCSFGLRWFSCRLRWRFSILFWKFKRFKFNWFRLERRRILVLERLKLIIGNAKLLCANHAKAHQLKKTAGCGNHIAGGIVRVLERRAEKFLMQLGQVRPFGLAILHNGAEIGRALFGAERTDAAQGVFHSESKVLAADYVHIELDVMTHNHRGFLQVGGELAQDKVKVATNFERLFGCDVVHLFGNVERNDEPVGFDDVVFGKKELSVQVVALPGQLHKARPVGEIGQWRLVIGRQTGCLGVENQEHFSCFLSL